MALALRLSGSPFSIECVGNFIWPTSLPPAHPAYRQTDRETDTHTQTHCKTHFMGHRVQSSESEGQAKPRQQKTDREREQKKPGQKLIMARTARKRLRGQSVRERERTPRWEDGNADQKTIIKILLVGHCMGRRVARPESAPESSFQLPALSLSSCLHFVSVYLPN